MSQTTSVEGTKSASAKTIVGIKNSFHVSAVLCLVAAGFSLVRGKEDRQKAATLG